MAEYRLTPAAEVDLEGIWRYTAQEWNVEQAHRYIDMLTTAFASLQSSPKRLQPVITFDLAIAAAVLSST